jgi:hypothetical protein
MPIETPSKHRKKGFIAQSVRYHECNLELARNRHKKEMDRNSSFIDRWLKHTVKG